MYFEEVIKFLHESTDDEKIKEALIIVSNYKTEYFNRIESKHE